MPLQKIIPIFNPNQANPEDLEAIFVQRKAMLADAVERVVESATTKNKHHLLFVGPRGSGKSHFVALLNHRLQKDEPLEKKVHVAWLNEDETITSLLHFFIKVYAALHKRYLADYPLERIEPVYEKSSDDRQIFAQETLLESLGKHTLLIIVENLDILFDNLGLEGQRELRALFQEKPVFTILATAQKLNDSLKKRENPFYGFFQTEHLKPLNIEEAASLLSKIATLNKQPEVSAFLCSSKGRARVRSLHHLSGGNHRIYLALSQFLTKENVDSLVKPFMKMVDELTPYYQERLRALSPLQRQIVEFLCRSENTVPVKKIAKHLFASHPTVSKQLMELREKGYVSSVSKGRESLYSITEPLMRICVEAKENQNQTPLRILVSFLRVWYEHGALKAKAISLTENSLSRSYCEAALEKNNSEGNLRMKWLISDIQQGFPDHMPREWQENILSGLSDSCEEFIVATKHIQEGEHELAIEAFEEGAKDGETPLQKINCLWRLSELYESLEKKEEVLTTIIGMQDTPVDQIAWALLYRGFTYVEMGELEKALQDYTTLIGMQDAPVDQIARALLSRGVTYGEMGELEKALQDYTTLIGMQDAPVDQIAWALFNRGVFYFKANNSDLARKDFQRIVNLQQVSVRHIVDSYLALAVISQADEKWEEGVELLRKGLKLGSQESSPYFGDVESGISVLFNAGGSQELREKRIKKLSELYLKYNATEVLGEGVIKHLGLLYKSGYPLPHSDNLQQWAEAWFAATRGHEEFRLPMRILKAGIEFLQAGKNKTDGLVTLISTERELLKQALGIEDGI